MILLVLCRDGYLLDRADPVNLAGRWSPGNAGGPAVDRSPTGNNVPCSSHPSDPHPGLQSGPPLKVGSGRNIFRPKVRIIVARGRSSLPSAWARRDSYGKASDG